MGRESSPTGFHAGIFSQFENFQNDSALARQYEDVFNFLLYGTPAPYNKTDYVSCLQTIFEDGYKEQLKKRLQNNPKFKDIVGINYDSLAVDGNYSSGRKAALNGDLFESFIDEVGKCLSEGANYLNNTQGTVSSITGQDKRVVLLLEDWMRAASQIFENRKNIRLSRKVTGQKEIDSLQASTVPKQIKTDVDWNKLSISVTGGSEKMESLVSNSTFTAKNYDHFPVHLGDIIQVQAYASMVNFYAENDAIYSNPESIVHMFEWYLSNDKENEFFQHMNHIVKIEALTGAGDKQVSKIGTGYQVIGLTTLPRFLVVNSRNQNKIYVRSTFKLINSLGAEKNPEPVPDSFVVSVEYRNTNGGLGSLISRPKKD